MAIHYSQTLIPLSLYRTGRSFNTKCLLEFTTMVTDFLIGWPKPLIDKWYLHWNLLFSYPALNQPSSLFQLQTSTFPPLKSYCLCACARKVVLLFDNSGVGIEQCFVSLPLILLFFFLTLYSFYFVDESLVIFESCLILKNQNHSLKASEILGFDSNNRENWLQQNDSYGNLTFQTLNKYYQYWTFLFMSNTYIVL